MEGCKQLTDEALAPLLPPVSTAHGTATDELPSPPSPVTCADAEPCGDALLRLNCAWVDLVTTDCLHAILRAFDLRSRRRRRGGTRLKMLDYYGNCWGAEDGRPVRCTMTDEATLGIPLDGWDVGGGYRDTE